MRRGLGRCRPKRSDRIAGWRGFTLVEMVVAIAIFATLMALAIPSYRSYVQRTSREAAKAELIELAGIEEKIFLNTNAYSANVSAGYTGAATGGLGVSSGRTRDDRYTLSVTVSGQSFTLTATPVAGSTQADDGTLTIDSAGRRTWGSATW